MLINPYQFGAGGGWNPASIPGLKLDLNAALGCKKEDNSDCADGDEVYHWLDQSGQSNDGTQGSDTGAVWRESLINGLPGLEFDGSNKYTLPDFCSGFTEGEAFIVVRVNHDPPAYMNALWKFGTGIETCYPFQSGVIYDQFGTSSRHQTEDPQSSLGLWRIYSVHSKDNDWSNYLDGVELFHADSNSVAFTGAPYIGYTDGTSDYHLDGSVARVLMFDHKLNGSQRDYIINGLKALYFSFQSELLLDIPGLDAPVAAYSTARKLRADYAGAAFQCLRKSDMAVMDIGFVNDEVDMDALHDFLNPASEYGFVNVLYDQSGNGLDLNAVAFYTDDYPWCGGHNSPLLPNGKLGFGTQYVPGQDQTINLATANAALNFTEASIAVVTTEDLQTPHVLIAGDDGNDYARLGDTQMLMDGGSGVVTRQHDDPPYYLNGYLHLGLFGSTSDTFRNRMNAKESGSSISGTPDAMASVSRRIFVGGKANDAATSQFNEVIVWPTVLGSDAISKLEGNVNAFYNVF